MSDREFALQKDVTVASDTLTWETVATHRYHSGGEPTAQQSMETAARVYEELDRERAKLARQDPEAKFRVVELVVVRPWWRNVRPIV